MTFFVANGDGSFSEEMVRKTKRKTFKKEIRKLRKK